MKQVFGDKYQNGVKVPLTHNSCRVGEATHSPGESVSRSRVLQAGVGCPKHR